MPAPRVGHTTVDHESVSAASERTSIAASLAAIDVPPNTAKLDVMTTPQATLVQPYLFFGGRCEEALEFYRTALGAQLQMLTRFNESPEPHPNLPDCFENKVMHASVRIGETTLMASDGMCDGKANFEGFSLSLVVPDETEADRVFAALSEGGLVTMPLEKTFWAPQFGMLQDRFGVGWMVSVLPKPEPTGAV